MGHILFHMINLAHTWNKRPLHASANCYNTTNLYCIAMLLRCIVCLHLNNGLTVFNAEKKEWKVAPDLIKTKSNKPKRLKEGKEGRGVGTREEQKNRENLGKTARF